jgi:hypothetical protein
MANGPWDEYKKDGEGPWSEYVAAPTAPKPEAPKRPSMQDITASREAQRSRLAGLTLRGVLEGTSGLAALPLDAAVAAYNLATGQRLRQPSQAISQSLTALGLPVSRGAAETGMTMAAGALASGPAELRNLLSPRLQNLPTGRVGDLTMQDILLEESRGRGYVVPPATVGTRPFISAVEGVGGKVLTEKAASAQNQKITNALAAESIGLPTNKPLSPAAIQEVRNAAGSVYAKIKRTGDVSADDEYLNDLAAIEDSTNVLIQNFPDLPIDEMAKIRQTIGAIAQPGFTSEAAVELIKRLRNQASDNLRFMVDDPAQKALGRAQLSAAEAVEALLARNLRNQGVANLADEFDEARRTIARTYTVEQAFNPATGNVNAQKLAAEVRQRKPLSGPLELSGRFAEAFPLAAQEVRASPVSTMDAIATGLLGTGLYGAGGLGGATLALGYPLARYGARSGVLGDVVQESLLRRGPQGRRGGLLLPTVSGAQVSGQPLQQRTIPSPLPSGTDLRRIVPRPIR